MPDIFGELRTKAQDRIAKQIFAAAKETDVQLRAIGGPIAQEYHCIALYGPLKDMGRASEKIGEECGGDWYELKDVARMTIVAPDHAVALKVKTAIEKRCVASQSMGLAKNEFQSTRAGYTGYNFVVRLQNGRLGEIQVNVPNVLYCKMSEKSFRELIGYTTFLNIKGKYGVRGGIGHALYELIRTTKGSPEASNATSLSARYYGYLGGFPNWSVGKTIDAELGVFVKANPALFIKH